MESLGNFNSQIIPPQNAEDDHISLDFEDDFLSSKDKNLPPHIKENDPLPTHNSEFIRKFIKFPGPPIPTCTIIHLHNYVNEELSKLLKTFEKQSKDAIKTFQKQASLLCSSIVHNYTSSHQIQQINFKKKFSVKVVNEMIKHFKDTNTP